MTEFYISVKCPTCKIFMLNKKKTSHVYIRDYYEMDFDCPKCHLKINVDCQGDGDLNWDEVIG